MPFRIRVPIVTVVYKEVDVETTSEELAIEEAMKKINEMNIAAITQEITQSDGTVHIDCVDEWEIGDYEIVDE